MPTELTSCVVSRLGTQCKGLKVVTGDGAPDEIVEAIAPLIVSQALQRLEAKSIFVIRKGGRETTLSVFGDFDRADLIRLEALSARLNRADLAARYVDYRQAEADCENLARKLIASYGRDKLRSFAWHAVPRGGLVVFGMLSYLLDLPGDAQDLSRAEGKPVVLVDDCSLSGLRFGELRQRFPERDLIFAHLYSHPDLRRAMVEREARVKDCVSANDLNDLAPELYGDKYLDWKSEWARRSGDDLYWIGQPEFLCFAWSEPENSFWNDAAGRLEQGWRIVPGSRCLRQRSYTDSAELQKDETHPRLQVMPEPAGPLRAADQVVYARMEDGSVAVADHSGSECFRLEDTAAEMWLALMDHGEMPKAAIRLRQRYDTTADRLEDDLNGFVRQLKDSGLLVEDS